MVMLMFMPFWLMLVRDVLLDLATVAAQAYDLGYVCIRMYIRMYALRMLHRTIFVCYMLLTIVCALLVLA
jgi:hypothetical protein